MRRIFHYSGDVSAENGGMFYCLDTYKDGYVDAVRIQPCSDAGGPDNCFWVEVLTINLRKGKELDQALQSCGPSLFEYYSISRAARRHVEVQACAGYGYYDQTESRLIQVGSPDPLYNGYDEFNPAVVLRSGTSILNYARKLCKNL